jgi:hypothetical protein
VPAQQIDARPRRIGVFLHFSDAVFASSRVAAFQQGLDKLGRTMGGNLAIDYR